PLTPFLRSNVARPPRHTLFPYTPLFRSQFLPHHLGTCPAQPEIEPLQRYCDMLQRDGESLVDGLRGQHDHPPLAICLSACPWPLGWLLPGSFELGNGRSLLPWIRDRPQFHFVVFRRTHAFRRPYLYRHRLDLDQPAEAAATLDAGGCFRRDGHLGPRRAAHSLRGGRGGSGGGRPDGPPDSTLARPAEPIGPHCRPSAPSPAGGECRDAKGGALGDACGVCAPGAGADLSGARASPRDGSGAASVGTGADGAANRLLRHAHTLRQPEP